MEKLDINRGLFSKIEGDKLGKIMEDIFGNVSTEGDWFITKYGAMQPLKVKILSKSELALEINTVKIPDDEVMDTMRKRNQFLEEITGFNSKQRLKRLKEKAKKGGL
jgi:hypothetical protein